MHDDIARFQERMRDSCDFTDVDLAADINACSLDGDNALHLAVRDNDLAAARALIDAGIEIDKAGDLGYTPLHNACIWGHVDMVKLLVEKGADLFALSEGYPPFTSARLAKHDHICDLLGPLMEQAQSQDPKVWIRARIAQLRREIARLEAQLET
jgi:ankyrin repeat protein